MSLFKSMFGGGGPRQVTLQPDGRTFSVGKNETVLESALKAGINYPHDCTVGTCGSCRSKLLDGDVRAITPFGYTLSKEELDAGMILACQAVPKSELMIEVDIPAGEAIPVQTMNARLVAIDPLTHDIVKLTWECDGRADYIAGQYMNIRWPGCPGPRSYSFCAAPTAGGSSRVSAFVRNVPGGAFSELLFNGDARSVAYEIDLPHGNFWLRDDEAPIILIGGGSGLSPLMSVLEDAVSRGVKRDAILLFGGRAERDLYCDAEIAAIAAKWVGKFDYWPILSETESAAHRFGLVTQCIPEALAALSAGGGVTHGYLCGPPGMIDAAIATLVAAGTTLDHIHYDKFTDASTVADV